MHAEKNDALEVVAEDKSPLSQKQTLSCRTLACRRVWSHQILPWDDHQTVNITVGYWAA